jgi:RHS repeat-associated protein
MPLEGNTEPDHRPNLLRPTATEGYATGDTDPFGNTTVTSGSFANEFQYAGRENDGTGLYFSRARYYNPTLQRFVSEDPIGFKGGDANLYAYAQNSPTNFTDPTGNSNSAIHIVETYLGGRDAGLGMGDALNLAVQSALVDIGTQGLGAAVTNVHAMSGQLDDKSYQNPSQAYDGAASLLSQ